MEILLIDDDPEQLRAFKERLEEIEGAPTVIPASSVEEGKAAFSERRNTIDLVVTDMHFGDERPEGGLEIVEHVAGAAGAPPPVIVLTVHGAMKNVIRCMEAGAFSYVLKGDEHSFEDLRCKLTTAASAGRAAREAESMARAVCKMVDMHEPYTGGHSERVGAYSRIIAAGLRLGNLKCERAWRAGLVHDLAKVGVDSEILTRPARLSTPLMAAIEAHPVEGYKMLRDVGAENDVCMAVLEHHRRIDGLGYPKHHKDLPPWAKLSQLGQIVGLADSFDAMTTPRPYMSRDGRDTFAKALSHLKIDASRTPPMYDMDLVKVLEQELQKIWDVFVTHVAQRRLPLSLIERNLRDLPSPVADRSIALGLLPSD